MSEEDIKNLEKYVAFIQERTFKIHAKLRDVESDLFVLHEDLYRRCGDIIRKRIERERKDKRG